MSELVGQDAIFSAFRRRFGCACEGRGECAVCAILLTLKRHHGLNGISILLGSVKARRGKGNG